jgi:hypothetical protein
MITRILATTAALLIASPIAANSWTGETADGVHMAAVQSDGNEIMVMCDAGISAPITSISFLINGVAPAAGSNIQLYFDKDKPLYIAADDEGAIGSATQTDATTFTKVIGLIKSSNRLKVRLFNGAEHKFRLTGSTKAIGNCTADFNRFTLASN